MRTRETVSGAGAAAGPSPGAPGPHQAPVFCRRRELCAAANSRLQSLPQGRALGLPLERSGSAGTSRNVCFKAQEGKWFDFPLSRPRARREPCSGGESSVSRGKRFDSRRDSRLQGGAGRGGDRGAARGLTEGVGAPGDRGRRGSGSGSGGSRRAWGRPGTGGAGGTGQEGPGGPGDRAAGGARPAAAGKQPALRADPGPGAGGPSPHSRCASRGAAFRLPGPRDDQELRRSLHPEAGRVRRG